MIDALRGTALQVGLACALVWGVARLSGRPFAQAAGLVAPRWSSPRRALWLGAAAALGFRLLCASRALRWILIGPYTPAGRLRGAPFTRAIVAALLLQAVVQTALSQELLFRGALRKAAAARLGAGGGNAAQAALFGLLHAALFRAAAPASAAVLAAIAAATGAYGAFLGELAESSGGSILPSWLAHAVTNALVYLWIAFVV